MDGEKPYRLSPSTNQGHDRESWGPKEIYDHSAGESSDAVKYAKTMDERAYFEPKDHHTGQTAKHWDWEEGTPFNDETVRELSTDGRMGGHESLNDGYGWDLHRGQITKDSEGRTMFSLNNPVTGFSNNVIRKHILDTEPIIGKEDHQATVVPGSKSVPVESGELHVHRGEHTYVQPKHL